MTRNEQQNTGLANGVPPPEGVGTSQSHGRHQELAASSQDQAPAQDTGLDLVPTTPQPFATAMSQSYGATNQATRPMQVGVTTAATVAQQAQAGLRQGFQWLGKTCKLSSRTMGNLTPGEFQIDPLLVPSLPNCMGPKSRMSRVAQNTTAIQAEVRRQVSSEFVAQQAQAMNHLQRENSVLRERLDAQQSPPQLTQPINPTPQGDLPQPEGQPRSFHPGRGEALVPLQGSSATQEGARAPEGKGVGGFGVQLPTQQPQNAQPSGLNLAASAGSITGRREAIRVVPPAERQGYAAGVPCVRCKHSGRCRYACPSYVSAGPAAGSSIPGANAQVPTFTRRLPWWNGS